MHDGLSDNLRRGSYLLIPYRAAASESMSPLLNPGDMVAIEKSVSFADIQVGDILVFREPIPTSGEAAFVISRVSEILIDPHD